MFSLSLFNLTVCDGSWVGCSLYVPCLFDVGSLFVCCVSALRVLLCAVVSSLLAGCLYAFV